MLALYKQGSTLQSIGNRYRLTRERVRQILTNTFNVRGPDGGASVVKALKVRAKKAAKDKYCFSRWGCSADEKAQMPPRCRKAWAEQKRSARYRGIEFSLSLRDFWSIWKESGKWAERGRGGNLYCMSRVNDAGGYYIGNVQVITNATNVRLYQLQRPSSQRRRPKEQRGVYLMYPGYPRPFNARYGKRSLGLFETEELARAARNSYLAKAA